MTPADLSRRRAASLHRGDHHGGHGGAATARSCCATSSSYRRSAIAEGEQGPSASTCCRPAPIRRARERLARLLARRASRCGAPRSRSRQAADGSPAGTYVVPVGAAGRPRCCGTCWSPHVAAAGCVREGAGAPPEEAAGRPDLRRHRLEPAARVRRRGRASDATRDRVAEAPDAPPGRRHGVVAAAPCASPLPAARSAICCRGARPPRRPSSRRCGVGCAMRTAERLHAQRPGYPARHRDRPRTRTTAPMSRPRWARWSPGTASRSSPIDSAFVESGISLGSSQVVPLKTPRVLLAWDAPTSSAVRRLGALRARAPLRPARDGRARRLAAARRPRRATTSSCCRRATTRRIGGDAGAAR